MCTSKTCVFGTPVSFCPCALKRTWASTHTRFHKNWSTSVKYVSWN
jgi:hypothetical protein